MYGNSSEAHRPTTINMYACGSCRQVMNEYEVKQKSPIKIYLMSENNQVLESRSVENFLPFKFSADILKEYGT